MKQRLVIAIVLLLGCLICSASCTTNGNGQIGTNPDPDATLLSLPASCTFDDTKVQMREVEPLSDSKFIDISSTGECAADMYRPDGYHPRIGSALALKLSLHKDVPDMVYDVVIPCFHRFWKEGDCMVERLGDRLDLSSWKCWTRILSPDRGIEEKYHARLTRDQIYTVVESGLSCLYLGSGKGNITDMSFENPRGIETYCELVGDMYKFASDGSIVHKPDLKVEGLIELDP